MTTFEGVKDTIAQDGDVRVTLEWIGEGYSGDYDESDPEDAPLMRFYVETYDGNEWHEVEDSSYCTGIRADKPETHQTYAESILAAIVPSIRSGASVKRLCEELSWIALAAR